MQVSINVLPLTDTHCHLNLNTFKSDLPEVLGRAWEAGLERILIPAIDLAGSREIVELCDTHPALHAAVGVHPNDALTWEKDTLRHLEELTQHPKVVAIGEIGLDYYREYAPVSLQKEILAQQLELAEKAQLPIIVHNREAFDDLWHLLSGWQARLENIRSKIADHPGVFHSFSEDVEKMQLVVAQKFFIGISGPVTYKNASITQAVAAATPIDHLLTETDAPFLTPHPFRGQRNEPAHVRIITEKIAQVRKEDIGNLARTIQRNSDRLFSWRPSI